MKAILIPFLSLLIPLTPKSAFAQSEPELKLESVVIVSRHGVRAPTKATQLMQDVTPDAGVGNVRDKRLTHHRAVSANPVLPARLAMRLG